MARARAREVVARDDVARVLVVLAILDDELHLVVRAQPVEVAPVVPLGLAAARALHVENGDDLGGHALGAAVSAGLEQHRAAALEQRLHQRVHVLLQQRLAAGDLDERTVVPLDLGEHCRQRTLVAFVERVRRVAPRAAQVARGEPDEDARPARVGRLALDRVENLVNRQQSLLLSTTTEASGSGPGCMSVESARRAGTTRPARARGTACSTRPRARRGRAPPASTSCGSTPSTSIRSRSTRPSTGSRAPRSPRDGPRARRRASSSR